MVYSYILGLIFFLKGQKFQYQAIAKHFSFPEQTTSKKNDIR